MGEEAANFDYNERQKMGKEGRKKKNCIFDFLIDSHRESRRAYENLYTNVCRSQWVPYYKNGAFLH
jgi:hypothetical protein